nr:hypothetical protein Itr_chr15CG08730 [Ipomoea trifida]
MAPIFSFMPITLSSLNTNLRDSISGAWASKFNGNMETSLPFPLHSGKMEVLSSTNPLVAFSSWRLMLAHVLRKTASDQPSAMTWLIQRPTAVPPQAKVLICTATITPSSSNVVSGFTGSSCLRVSILGCLVTFDMSCPTLARIKSTPWSLHMTECLAPTRPAS